MKRVLYILNFKKVSIFENNLDKLMRYNKYFLLCILIHMLMKLFIHRQFKVINKEENVKFRLKKCQRKSFFSWVYIKEIQMYKLMTEIHTPQF